MPLLTRTRAAIAAITLSLALILTACGGGAPSAQQVGSPAPNSSSDTTSSSLAITTPQLPIGSLGQSYTGALNASGNTGAVKWSVLSGALPAGVTLAGDTGAISGTPMKSGVFTVAIQAADSVATVTRNVTMHVSGNGTYYHQYSKPGRYQVKVTRVDAQGNVSVAVQTITVSGN